MVDHLDKRFWSFHTTMPIADAMRCLRNAVGSRSDLDWMWLPSAHLSNIWRGASLQWLAADYHARKLSPSEDPVNDLQVQLRVRGHQADEVLRVIAERYETGCAPRRSRDIGNGRSTRLGQREDQLSGSLFGQTVTTSISISPLSVA